MGEKKMAALGFGMIAVIIVIIVGVVVWAIGPGETKSVEQDESTNTQDVTEEYQEPDERVVNLVDSIDEYQKTNEIMESYSTVGIIEDILDDKTTALDDRIEYHSMTEVKDGMNKDDLLYIVGEIEYEVTACEQKTHTTGIAGLMENLRYDIEDKIKSGYGKDSSIMPILERAKVAINAYSDCTDKSGNQ